MECNSEFENIKILNFARFTAFSLRLKTMPRNFTIPSLYTMYQ